MTGKKEQWNNEVWLCVWNALYRCEKKAAGKRPRFSKPSIRGGCAWHDSGKMDAKLVGNGFAWGIKASSYLTYQNQMNRHILPCLWTNANGIHHA